MTHDKGAIFADQDRTVGATWRDGRKGNEQRWRERDVKGGDDSLTRGCASADPAVGGVGHTI